MDVLNFKYPNYERLDEGARGAKRKRVVNILNRHAIWSVKEDQKALKNQKTLSEPKKRKLVCISPTETKVQDVADKTIGHCNTLSNPWTNGTYSRQVARIIYCPHRPTRVFCVHFVLTHAHPRKLPGRSPIPNCSKPSTLNLEVFRDRLLKKKMHLVGMDTILILLSLGPGYHHPSPLYKASQYT
jgi:hypothetical protein